MVSGGWGKHLKKSHLPGLSQDLTPHDDLTQASYRVNHARGKTAIHVNWLQGGMNYGTEQRKDKKGNILTEPVGFFIALEPEQDVGERNGFGIHPDGLPLGTEGCIGIVLSDAARFEKLWSSIRMPQRPDHLYVVEPEHFNLKPAPKTPPRSKSARKPRKSSRKR